MEPKKQIFKAFSKFLFNKAKAETAKPLLNTTNTPNQLQTVSAWIVSN